MGGKKIVETFIKTYDNAIPHVLCDMLIEKFDTNTDQWENRDKRTEDRGNLKFNEVHLFKYSSSNCLFSCLNERLSHLRAVLLSAPSTERYA